MKNLFISFSLAPLFTGSRTVRINGQPVKYRREGEFSAIENIGLGKWSFVVEQSKIHQRQ
jgi:hypothetical protein